MSEETLGVGVTTGYSTARQYNALMVVTFIVACVSWYFKLDAPAAECLLAVSTIGSAFFLINRMLGPQWVLIVFIPVAGVAFFRMIRWGLDPKLLQFMHWYGWATVFVSALMNIYVASVKLLRS